MARLPDDEIQRRFEENLAKIDITPEEAEALWPNIDPDDRERRRRAKIGAMARHATVVDDETGQRMLGGAQPKAGRKGKADVMQTISELADGERQKEVVDALFASLDSKNDPAVRGKGAERIVRLKIEHAEMERRDREELRQLDKDQLIDRLAKGILAGGMGDALIKALGQSKTAPNGTPYDVDARGVEIEAPSMTNVDFKAA